MSEGKFTIRAKKFISNPLLARKQCVLEAPVVSLVLPSGRALSIAWMASVLNLIENSIENYIENYIEHKIES